MSSFSDPQKVPPSSRPWTQALLTVLVAAAAVCLIANHWLHILDALPYLGPGTSPAGRSNAWLSPGPWPTTPG